MLPADLHFSTDLFDMEHTNKRETVVYNRFNIPLGCQENLFVHRSRSRRSCLFELD